MKRAAGLCLFIAALTLSSRGNADGSMVLNGAQVSYLSQTSFRIGYGTVNIGGTEYTTFGGAPNTVGTVYYGTATTCSVGFTPSALTAYYVYELWDANNSTLNPIVSPVQPWEDGYPMHNLYAPTGTGGACQSYSNLTFGFLGSIITDTYGHILPFQRNGEQVILAFNGGGTTATTQGTPQVVFNWNGAESVQSTVIPSSTWVYPLSATALIFDGFASSTDANIWS